MWSWKQEQPKLAGFNIGGTTSSNPLTKLQGRLREKEEQLDQLVASFNQIIAQIKSKMPTSPLNIKSKSDEAKETKPDPKAIKVDVHPKASWHSVGLARVLHTIVEKSQSEIIETHEAYRQTAISSSEADLLKKCEISLKLVSRLKTLANNSIEFLLDCKTSEEVIKGLTTLFNLSQMDELWDRAVYRYTKDEWETIETFVEKMFRDLNKAKDEVTLKLTKGEKEVSDEVSLSLPKFVATPGIQEKIESINRTRRIR